MVTVKNIFAQTTSAAPSEELHTLWENSGVKIERIVSYSHSSPEGFWYDQDRDEWVIVLCGSATLEFVGGELIEMTAGDYLTIPARLRHRVARTGAETIWLAVHMK